LERAWDVPNSRLKYIIKNEQDREEIAIEKIADSIKRWTRDATPDSKGRILSIDVVDKKMAVTKFEFLWKGTTYIDYLALYKVDGSWKIVNKIFVAR
jgi:hypothetical protein